MKKFLLVTVTALTIALTAGCGLTDKEQDSGSKLTTASQQQTASASAGSTGFKVLPDNAKKALDLAGEGSKKAYPSADENRSFGYMGKSSVNGSECYCFSVFETQQEQTSQIADIAVSADFNKVYASDPGKAQYKEISLVQTKSGQWCDTKTSAFS